MNVFVSCILGYAKLSKGMVLTENLLIKDNKRIKHFYSYGHTNSHTTFYKIILKVKSLQFITIVVNISIKLFFQICLTCSVQCTNI